MDFAADDARDFEPGVTRDPIATVRAVVRQIRKTSIRRQYFSAVLQTLKEKDLQLLRDVDTRWSSTLLMVERAILLREAITLFLRKEDFAELRSYMLDDDEWDDLELYRRILSVPHAFQQKLSAEKTPTLCNALPAYEAMVKVWKEMQDEIPQIAPVIEAGLEKLESYIDRTELTNAYVLAMALNPRFKLDWIRKHQPRRLSSAKD
ncbi:ribonuclease H-like domain-containing protein, partial [Mycena floridula]